MFVFPVHAFLFFLDGRHFCGDFFLGLNADLWSLVIKDGHKNPWRYEYRLIKLVDWIKICKSEQKMGPVVTHKCLGLYLLRAPPLLHASVDSRALTSLWLTESLVLDKILNTDTKSQWQAGHTSIMFYVFPVAV